MPRVEIVQHNLMALKAKTETKMTSLLHLLVDCYTFEAQPKRKRLVNLNGLNLILKLKHVSSFSNAKAKLQVAKMDQL